MSFFNRCLDRCQTALAAVLLLLVVPAEGQGRIASDTGIVTLAWDRNPEADVAGYRFHFGPSSGTYDQVVDLGNLSEAVITMTAGRTYFCAISAYNFSGVESDLSAELAVSYVSGAPPVDNSSRLVMLEAEAGVLGAQMATASASGDTWVDAAAYPVLETATTLLSFAAPVLSNYVVWCRVKGPTAGSDSMFYSMDNAAEQIFHVYGVPEPAEPRSSGWIWRRILINAVDPQIFNLTQGNHTLKFRSREKGTLLDRIVISNDLAFVPSEDMPPAGDFVKIVTGPQTKTVTAGQTASLNVKAAATGPVTYQWKKNGISIPGANSSTFSIANSVAADSGTYTVELKTGVASANSGTAILTVSVPVMTVGAFSVSEDQSVTFSVSGQLGSTVKVYASDNLSDWEYIGERPNTTGTIVIEDPEGAGSPNRFYRLQEQ